MIFFRSGVKEGKWSITLTPWVWRYAIFRTLLPPWAVANCFMDILFLTQLPPECGWNFYKILHRISLTDTVNLKRSFCYWTYLINKVKRLTRYPMLSSDIPLMRFLNISRQKFSSLKFIRGIETFSNFKFSQNCLHSETFRDILFVLSFRPLFQQGIYACENVLYNSHCNKKRHSFELPLSGAIPDTSIVHTCTEVDNHIYLFHYLVSHSSLVLWLRRWTVNRTASLRICSNPDRGYIRHIFVLYWNISCLTICFFFW